MPSTPHVIHIPSFRHFLSSRALSSVAFQGSAVAIGWLIYDRTRNPFDLGLVGLFQFLPMLVLTFLAGHVADQFDRRQIGLICQVIEAVTMGFIALGIWQGWLPTWGIFAAVTVLGAAQAFERPSMAALLPGIVPTAQLQSAVATSTSVMQTALIIGPALGGILYGFGDVVPFLASGLLFLVASYNVLKIEKPATLPARAPMTVESVFAGVVFIKSKPVMLGSISLDLFAVLLGGATAMLPVYARDILHAGPWALGFLRMAPAIGAVAMSLLLARFPLQHRVGLKMLVAVAIFGLATIVFAYSTNIVLSVVMLIILGASDTVSVVVRSSLVQLLTPDHMRGRVNAVNSLFIGTSNQLGEFRAGVFAGFMGPVAAVAFGGIGTLAVVLLWSRLFPALRKVDTLSG
ncbi:MULTISPECIES: MFS transporter [unclassified Devosia]|uniref:MFS transporter n=1 Tax=unclassified Devosia TaxID=196773 RepID=UPI001AC94443|nr:MULTISPECIES: MFS transporter [unclassified Devosia]MBN9365206.1 MFS transporter [Devosia sp.]